MDFSREEQKAKTGQTTTQKGKKSKRKFKQNVN
jgi:hypothetical protein